MRVHAGSFRESCVCRLCNRFKGSDIASLDPASGTLLPLFNPRSDVWEEHFRVEG
jgi:hypothetical protein